MSTILYEVRRVVSRYGQPVILVPKEDLWRHRGFRSIYGFDEDACEYIQNENTTAGLHGHNFYSDDLLVDFDDTWAAAEEFAEVMLPYEYTMWDTGGRSIHFHITTEPLYGPDTPAIQKAWMTKYCPAADLGIYKSSGIYRLPGTPHKSKIGAKKILLDKNEGDVLELGDVREESRWIGSTHFQEEDLPELNRTLDNLLMLPASEGGRNNRLYWIADLCNRCGEDITAAMKLCLHWNHFYCNPPQTDREVETTVKSAYRRRHETQTAST